MSVIVPVRDNAEGIRELLACLEQQTVGRERFEVLIAFAGLDAIEAPGHELEDLYALASRDRLIGPPSTYNRWASFWGEVPLFQLREPGQQVAPKMFHVAHGLQWEPIPAGAPGSPPGVRTAGPG